MNRRKFLLNAYRVGGLFALYKLGLSFLESKAIADIDTFEGQAVDTGSTIDGASSIDTVEGQTIVSGGGSCTSKLAAYDINYCRTSDTQDGAEPIGDAASSFFVGQRLDYGDVNGYTICGVAFVLTLGAGDIESPQKTFHCEIWNSNSYAMGSQIGADSSGVAGSNSWSQSVVLFSFPTPVVVSGETTDINFVVTMDTTDASNYASMGFDGDNSYTTGARSFITTYQSDGSYGAGTAGRDVLMDIYYQT